MYRIQLVIFTLIFPLFIFANETTDSLQRALNNKPLHDTTHANILIALARNLRNIDTKLAEQYALESLKLSQGIYYQKGIAQSCDALGVIYTNNADFQKALYHTLVALRLNEAMQNEKAVAATCNNIGSVFFHLKKYPLALQYYQRSLAIKLKLGSKKEVSSTYINMGNVYMKTNNLKTCISFYQKALNNASAFSDTINISISLMNLGEAYFDKKDYKQALHYYSRALKVNTKRDDRYHMAHTLYAIGKIHLRQGNLEQAETFLLNSLNTSEKSGIRNLSLNTQKELSALYEAKLMFPKALDYYKRYHQLSDSIYNTENEKQVGEIQSKYENEKKDKRIALLEVNNALSKSTLARTTLFRNVLIVGFLLIIIILLVLVRNNILKQRVNTILSDKNQKIELQQMEIERQNKELSNYNKELMVENIAAKFEVLKSKINPHFLFNSLNTLTGLIVKDTPQAILFVTRFSKMFRHILDLNSQHLISIDEELEFVNEYIYLQKIRFKENIRFTINIPTEYTTGLVPPFCIQMVIENAIKHNIVTHKHPLSIHLFVEHNNLVISNNIQLKNAEELSTGLGQKNITERYKLISTLTPSFEQNQDQYIVTLPIIFK